MATGCTVIVNSAKQSPISALAFRKLVEIAGVLAGVVIIVTGNARLISDEIFENPVVRKNSFTGSTEVDELLVTMSAPQLKRLSLEFGGHAPFIVFDDADLEAAAASALQVNSGIRGKHAFVQIEFTSTNLSSISSLP